MRALKIVLWSVLAIVVLAVAGMMLFAYKITHGFPVSYETEVPAINFPAGKPAVLQQALENYVKQGGTWLGIHGAGDNSHQWDWYAQNLVGASFSHHPIEKHLQEAAVILNPGPDSAIVQGLPQAWPQTDEWYVFFDNPRSHGAQVVWSIDGGKINPSGNILFVKDKNFGMGKDHPVAWYRSVDKGRAFYTSIGHDAGAWKQAPFIKLLENEVQWAAKSKINK
jgi:type 1 glutamine amidotransferase